MWNVHPVLFLEQPNSDSRAVLISGGGLLNPKISNIKLQKWPSMDNLLSLAQVSFELKPLNQLHFTLKEQF